MSIDSLIRDLASDGLQINLWPNDRGFQANVKNRGGNGWTVFTAADPIEALGTALRQRAARVPDREVIGDAEQQIDLEEAIAGVRDAPVVGDEVLRDADGFCMVCEGGGCDACRGVVAPDAGDDYDGLLGE